MWSGASRIPGAWIARRYLVRRSNGYAAFTHWVSFIGLTLGVMILCVVVSVMNGFDRELKNRLLGVVPHGFIADTLEQPAGLEQVAGVLSVDQFFRGEAMVSRPGAVNPVQLYGVDTRSSDGESNRSTAFLRESIVSGSIDDARGGIVLGAPLARMMGLAVGDSVLLLVSTPTTSGIVPRIQKFRLHGTFQIGADPDYGLAIVDIADIQQRNLTSSGEVGLRVSVQEPFSIDELLAEFPSVATWSDEYGELFRAVRIEKTIMFVLLALVIAIAAFNIVSGQAMLINEKRGDIAILGTMGADQGLLVRVFMVQGLVVSIAGIGLGLGVGVLVGVNAGAVVAALEGLLGASMIEGTYFSRVPSEVRAGDLVTIALVSLALCGFAVIRPALLAARSNPAEVLHSK